MSDETATDGKEVVVEPMNCSGCGAPVTMLNFGIHGHGATFNIVFNCPTCGHKLKETYGEKQFKDAEDLARGMLIDL